MQEALDRFSPPLLPIDYCHLTHTDHFGQILLENPLLQPPFFDTLLQSSGRVKGEPEGNYQRIRVFVVWSCMDTAMGPTSSIIPIRESSTGF